MRAPSICFTIITGLIAFSKQGRSADTGVAASHMLQRPDGATANVESVTPVQRVRIPVTMQAWNSVQARASDGRSKESKIATKPLNHVLRARIERPNDFYLGDWRIQSTPIRWLKNTNQYQVRLEIYRRFGEAGQVEESLGTMNVTGVLSKQADGLYVLEGSSRRRFTDRNGQPLLDMEAGTPLTEKGPAPNVSKAGSNTRL